MKNQLISIVMPFRDTSAYLQECLDSIIGQTQQNWELLAVNDHSMDGSLDILKKYAKKDSRIQVYNNKGKGIIPALQLAYSKSKGELISRMDSDDIMPETKLEVLSKNLISHGRGHLATGQVRYFSEDGIGDGFQKYENWLNQLTKEGSNYQDLYKECVIPSPCWMVFREDFEKLGAFNSDIYPEDYDLAFRFYEHGLKVIPSDEILHLWRDYSSRTSRNDENYAYNSFIELKLNHFIKQNYNPKRDLILWGAGRKGKALAEGLLERKIPFKWICDNPKKIGKHIYDQEMLHWKTIDEFPQAQSIISVASPDGQKEIKKYLADQGLEPMKDVFFFC